MPVLLPSLSSVQIRVYPRESAAKITMKTIGLIGGMSWESTALYYRLLNQAIARRLGGLHSAQLILFSVDFHEIEIFQQTGAWDDAAARLHDAALALERGGAEFLVLCTNTMHKVADAITAGVNIPLLHIADPTAAAIQKAGVQKIGLLGTRFTMDQEFYRGRLETHGLSVMLPSPEDRKLVNRVIYDELCLGEVRDDSRNEYRRIITDMVQAGAQGIILGCTEIGMLVGPADSPVPTFDTTRIHAEAAADYALTPRGELIVVD
jgi:aspartate racemase